MCEFFQETVVPSFLIDPTVIWLDFEGPGLPESRNIEKKSCWNLVVFFGVTKIRQGTVFIDFGLHFEVSFGAPGCKKTRCFLVLFLEGSILNSGSLFLSKTMCFTRVFFRI